MQPSLSSGTPVGAASPLADKLTRYCAGVGALATAATLPAHSAQGAVSSYNAGGVTGNTFYLDLQHTAAPVVSATSFAGADFELYVPSGTNAKPTVKALSTTGGGIVASTEGSYTVASNLASNAEVSSGDSFDTPAVFPASSIDEQFYIGLELPGGTANANDHFYGFADLTVNAVGDTNRFTLNYFAYNDTLNAPIFVPEPNSALLLIAGAAGVGVLAARRRKAAGASPAGVLEA